MVTLLHENCVTMAAPKEPGGARPVPIGRRARRSLSLNCYLS
jgi:hypothetical protein